MKIVKAKIRDLAPAPYNPRMMPEQEMEKLKKSIKRFGYVEPIIVNKRTGYVVGGNQRLKALKDLYGDDYEIDVVMLDLSEKEEKALNVALNRISGDWDMGKLEEIIKELKGTELLDLTGLDTAEIDAFLSKEQIDERFDIEKAVKEPKFKVEYGDIWKLGEHRVACYDSTKIDYGKMLPEGEAIKLVMTSPPYNMAGGMYENYKDNLEDEEYIRLNLEALRRITPYLEGFVFWNISYNKNSRWHFIEILHKMISEIGLKFLELIVWDKGHGMPITSKKLLTREYELIMASGTEEAFRDLELYFIGTTESKAWFNKRTGKAITNYWRIGTQNTQMKGELKHLAMFPLEVPKRAISLMASHGEIVADPFAGVGTTLIASEILGRRGIMIELDPKYVSAMMERWQNLTGKEPERIGRMVNDD